MTSWKRMYSFVHSAFLCSCLGGRAVAAVMVVYLVSYLRYHQGLPDVEVEIVQLILHCFHALDCNIALPAEEKIRPCRSLQLAALHIQKDAKHCRTSLLNADSSECSFRRCLKYVRV